MVERYALYGLYELKDGGYAYRDCTRGLRRRLSALKLLRRRPAVWESAASLCDIRSNHSAVLEGIDIGISVCHLDKSALSARAWGGN